MEAYINKYLKVEVDLVGKLMSKLSTLKEAGRLRRTTQLRPVRRNVTRWLGVINMFERFERLRSDIDTSPQSGLAEFVPSLAQQNTMRLHQQALNDFKAVTLTLQSEKTTMGESEELFFSIIQEFPHFDFASYIGKDADIVHNGHFERGIIKVQSGFESQLDVEETNALQKLVIPNSFGLYEVEESQLSLVERALKRQRLKKNNSSGFMDTKFLVPTTNHVERLFSTSKRIFSTKRRSLLPRTLEGLVFLKENRELWNLPLVATIVNKIETFEEDQESSENSDSSSASESNVEF